MFSDSVFAHLPEHLELEDLEHVPDVPVDVALKVLDDGTDDAIEVSSAGLIVIDLLQGAGRRRTYSQY